MRSKTLLLLCIVAFQLAWASQAAALPQAERRVALIIGNSAYKFGPLKNPVNDARDMASTLGSLGFEVILRQDATLREMDDAIDQFWQSLKKGGVGLFFFAGHGVQVAGDNFLVPVDARMAVEKDVNYECVNAGKVLARMEDAGNGLNIMILDACRNNPFARSFRSASRGLAKMDAPTGSLIAFSTAPGDVASDGTGVNGLYTSHLLKRLRSPGLKLEDVLKQVRISVAEESVRTGKRQTPWESSSLMGDFYFVEAPPAPQGVTPPAVAAPSVAVPSPPKSEGLSGFFASLFRQTEGDPPATVTSSCPGADEETRKRWDRWQREMGDSAAQARKLEAVSGLGAADKAMAWGRVFEAYAADNPCSADDEALRAGAAARKKYWLAEAQKTAGATTVLKASPVPPPPLAAAPAAQGSTWRDPVTGMEFVWVPGGSFSIGCDHWDPECISDAKPSRNIQLSGFWLGKYEVTQGQWKKVMGGNPSRHKKVDNNPVDNVSWLAAQSYVAALNQEGKAKFRLPTEAEWEYAARSGGKRHLFAGGGNLDECAWYQENSGRAPHPGGGKAPNLFGVFDMSGNVEEWCEDVYDQSAYRLFASENPVFRSDKKQHAVVRGGHYSSSPNRLRTTSRDQGSLEVGGSERGLRLVRLP